MAKYLWPRICCLFACFSFGLRVASRFFHLARLFGQGEIEGLELASRLPFMWVLSPGPKIAFRNLRLLYRGDVIFAGLVIWRQGVCSYRPPWTYWLRSSFSAASAGRDVEPTSPVVVSATFGFPGLNPTVGGDTGEFGGNGAASCMVSFLRHHSHFGLGSLVFVKRLFRVPGMQRKAVFVSRCCC